MNNGEIGTLILFLIALFLILTAFEFTIRKLLGATRRKWFSYNHINERHKKVDWSVRIIFILLILIGTYYTISNEPGEAAWYFETWFIFTIFLITSEIVRAFMEWKYAKNKKDFVATIVMMVFAISILCLTIATDFFGLFAI